MAHVGFLIHDEGSWKVLHAINKKGNCIEQKEFVDFCAIGGEKLHLEFLEILDFKSKKRLISKIDSVKRYNLNFDYSFSSKAKKSIYCSWFVCEILKSVYSGNYHFKLSEKKLNAVVSSFLDKKTLSYYCPASFLPVGILFPNHSDKTAVRYIKKL